MKLPGFLSQLHTQLESIPIEILTSVNKSGGLDISDMINYTLKPVDHTVYEPEIVDVLDIDTTCNSGGTRNVGRTALCVLMTASHDFSKVSHLLNAGIAGSLTHKWIVAPREDHDALKKFAFDHDAKLLLCHETFGLTPDNQLARRRDSSDPLLLSCGSGDALAALESTSDLSEFIDSGGERVVFIIADDLSEYADLDNVLLSHVKTSLLVTCPVTPVSTNRPTSVLCMHDGVKQIVDTHRVKLSWESPEYTWTAAGVLVLEVTSLDLSGFQWKWNRIKKSIDNRLIVQFERSLYDLTSYFQTQFVNAKTT